MKTIAALLTLLAACRSMDPPQAGHREHEASMDPPQAGHREHEASMDPPQASAAPRASVPQDCERDSDCVPESCCGPFNADDPCVAARARRDCDAVVCALMLPAYSCACRDRVCATIPAPSVSAPSPRSSSSPPGR